jgi:hypothetical protein
MAKSDRVNEEIGWLKVVFAALIAIEFSLIGWVAQNADDAPTNLFVSAFTAMLGAGVIMIVVNRAAYRRIVRLERL